MATTSKPALPKLGWDHLRPAPLVTARRSLRKRVNLFAIGKREEEGSWKDPWKAPEERLLGYLQHLGAAENMSQLLQAELAYLCFMGADCPLLYHATEKQWFVYEQYWRARALSGPKVLFQDAETGFIPAAKKAVAKAESEDVFPPVGNGAKENPCLTFLKDLVEQLESREGVEKVINESAMLFWPEADPVFDMNEPCAVPAGQRRGGPPRLHRAARQAFRHDEHGQPHRLAKKAV